MQVEEQTNDSVEITSTGVAVDKTPDVVSISASEYEEYRKYKDRLSLESKGGHKSFINEIDTLASKYLSNHFNKEALLSKGYSLDEILLAQSRELIRKYVSPEQIKAIAKVESTEHIEGHILEQLLDLAKVHIKQRQNNENIRTASRLENNGVKFKEQISISNSNFRPINRTELTEGMIQFYINQQKQNSKRIIKRSA
ncbi:DUF1357 family protein [Borrelia hermsii]|uniref:DUF1357 family protein n=1 Tax=Borrelia hermsii TaxID=140 RepID=UPI001FF12D54|nr:DUF1357 family protein [Borrelia hermsii]UPA08271.1 DUF1357 family protein [Borrelia hermsii DAH]